MHNHKPIFFVFAGNNVSGKSTLRSLIIDKIGVDINIDPDAIARRFDLENPEGKRVSAGKESSNPSINTLKRVKTFRLRQHLLVRMLSNKCEKPKRWVMK